MLLCSTAELRSRRKWKGGTGGIRTPDLRLRKHVVPSAFVTIGCDLFWKRDGDKSGETSPHDCGAGVEPAGYRCSPPRHSPKDG